MPEQELDLSEVKKLLEQRVKEAESRIKAEVVKNLPLQSEVSQLRSELSRLSQSLARYEAENSETFAIIEANFKKIMAKLNKS